MSMEEILTAYYIASFDINTRQILINKRNPWPGEQLNKVLDVSCVVNDKE